jgi:hypothetical protein
MTITGAPDAFMWVTERLSGVPVKKGCRRKTQLTGLQDPRALAALGTTVIKFLLSLLTLPVGPIGR